MVIVCYLYTADADIIKDIYIRGVLEEQVEKVLKMNEERIPPPPLHQPQGMGGGAAPAPVPSEPKGVARFGKTAQPRRDDATSKTHKERAKEMVAKYLEWCDTAAAPTTATPWRTVITKWPSDYEPMHPELAQAFR